VSADMLYLLYLLPTALLASDMLYLLLTC
jgi:hypothetical protein